MMYTHIILIISKIKVIMTIISKMISIIKFNKNKFNNKFNSNNNNKIMLKKYENFLFKFQIILINYYQKNQGQIKDILNIKTKL